ncbi:MAG: aminotransferase class V-fold PLP-dependent enzyme [Thermoplasmata archaeon]|nr:MAG: aminotransferase class V-fold PLP-dependent enzyme [Thermoplasmata archaeon]
MKTIYFDNAATSWPKPESVISAMVNFSKNIGANPGRSGHRLSIEAGRVVNDAREKVAELFGVIDPMRVVFGLNATDALNLAMRGILRKGDHVITSSMEHNSVMRPLRDLERQGVELSVAQCSKEGILDPRDIGDAIRKNTRMIVLNHASNIVGTLLPVREVGKQARESGILLLVDAAQTAGCVPIDMNRDFIDLLAFTGHKSLQGPQGTGGLIIGMEFDIEELRPLKAGGTGSRSEFEHQPDFLPDRYESGTLNTVGLAGLAAGVKFVMDETVKRIREKEMELARRFLEGAGDIPGCSLYGPKDEQKQTSTISFNLDNHSPSETGLTLDEKFGIMCRVGLHCAPAAHRTIGTFPNGTVRFGFGYFNSEEEVDFALEALTKMVTSYER